jgi:hypothetical protein
LVEQISSLPFEVRLIKVATSRKNLLDFVLTFHLGEMTSRYPRGRYYIVSGDKKDFAPVIEHLKANHFHVSLHPDIASLPFLDQSIPAELAPAAPLKKPGAIAKPTLDRGTMIANLLLDPKTKNRPTTLPRLHARIKSDLGKDASPAKIDGVVSAIRAGGMTTDAKSKVCYP